MIKMINLFFTISIYMRLIIKFKHTQSTFYLLKINYSFMINVNVITIIGAYLPTGLWEVEPATRDPLRGDFGLVLKTKAKHAAISAKLDRAFVFKEKPLVVQYEVMFQEGQDCGGAYIKLLSVDKQNTDLKKFHDKTPYTIMFGPDKCASDYKVIN